MLPPGNPYVVVLLPSNDPRVVVVDLPTGDSYDVVLLLPSGDPRVVIVVLVSL